MKDENNVINLVDHIERKKKVDTGPITEIKKPEQYLLRLTPINKRIVAFGIDIFMVGMIKLSISISYAIYVQTFFDSLEFSQQVYLIHVLDSIEVFVALAVFISYFTMSFYIMEGRTVGKHLLRLRAVKNDFISDNSNTDLEYGLKESFLRTVGYFCAYLTIGLLYALPFFRKDKRSLADLFSKSMILTNDEVYNIFAYKTRNLFTKEDLDSQQQQSQEKAA